MLLQFAATRKLVELVQLNPVVRAEDYVRALRRERARAQTVGFYLLESVGEIELFFCVLAACALFAECVECSHKSLALKPERAGVHFPDCRFLGRSVALLDYPFNRAVRRADYPAVAGRVVYLCGDYCDAVALFSVQGERVVYCLCVDERSVAV